MWELIINAVGWIVGGSMEARANKIMSKVGVISSDAEKQIAEISGSAAEDAKREQTKQIILQSSAAKSESQKSDMPIYLAGGFVVAVVVFLLANEGNGQKNIGTISK